jgi:MarC family membrane protein
MTEKDFALMNTDFLLSTTILLFVITDPLGNIPFFVNALKNVAPARRRWVILRECLIATVALIFFAFLGKGFLEVMKLSNESLRIAGGVILFLIALKMIFPQENDSATNEPLDSEPFIVPLAIPLVAGPSAMATVLLLATQNPTLKLEMNLAILFCMVIGTIIFLAADRLQKWLGAKIMTAVERLMGLILTTVAVEMLLQGIASYLHSLSLT